MAPKPEKASGLKFALANLSPDALDYILCFRVLQEVSEKFKKSEIPLSVHPEQPPIPFILNSVAG